jgi:hypothetical protein
MTSISDMDMKRTPSLFPNDDAIRLLAQTKQAEADALPQGPDKRKLQKEANSYRILSEARGWLAGELGDSPS